MAEAKRKTMPGERKEITEYCMNTTKTTKVRQHCLTSPTVRFIPACRSTRSRGKTALQTREATTKMTKKWTNWSVFAGRTNG